MNTAEPADRVLALIGADQPRPGSLEAAIRRLVHELRERRPTDEEIFNAKLSRFWVGLRNVFMDRSAKIKRTACERCKLLPPHLFDYCAQCLLLELQDRVLDWERVRDKLEREVATAKQAGLQRQLQMRTTELEEEHAHHAYLYRSIVAEAARRRLQAAWGKPLSLRRVSRYDQYIEVERYAERLPVETLQIIADLRKFLAAKFPEYSTIVVSRAKDVGVELRHQLPFLGLVRAYAFLEAKHQ